MQKGTREASFQELRSTGGRAEGGVNVQKERCSDHN